MQKGKSMQTASQLLSFFFNFYLEVIADLLKSSRRPFTPLPPGLTCCKVQHLCPH